MANRDFEMNLRLKADFASAQKALASTEDSIERITRATEQANREMAATPAASPVGGSGGGAATAQEASATTDLNAALQGNISARQAQAAAIRATQEAVAAEIGLIGDLQERLDRSAGSFDDLADTEARLDAAMSKGLITTEEYNAALVKLDKDQQRLTQSQEKSDAALGRTVARYDKAGAGLARLKREEEQLKQAVDAGRISREQYNRAIEGIGVERLRLTALRAGAEQSAKAMRGLNFESLGVQRNLTQLATYAATGNFRLAGAQIVQLGNQAGVARLLLSGLGLTLGVVGAAGAVFATAMVKSYLELRAFDNALLSTGNILGTTAGNLSNVTTTVAAATGAYGDAEKAVAGLAKSGVVTVDSLQAAAQAALDLSELTGQSIENTTQQIIKLAKAPSETLAELNEQYHFLTLEVYDHVRSLEEQGNATGAAEAAIESFARVHAQRVEEAREKAGSLERAWIAVKASVLGAFRAIGDIGRQDIEGRLNAAQRELQALAKAAEIGQVGGIPIDNRNLQRRLTEVRARIASIKEEKSAIDARNESEAEEQELQDAAVRARANIDRKLEAGLDNRAKKQKALNDLVAEFNLLDAASGGKDRRLFDGSFERRKKQIEEEFKDRAGPRTPKPKKTDSDRSEDAAQRELLNLQKQLDALDSLADGQKRVSEAARIRFEIEQGAYKNASAATQQALIDNAQLLDSERQRIEVAKAIADAQLEVLRLQGNEQEAFRLGLERDFDQTMRNLGLAATDANREIFEKLFDLRIAKNNLDALERELEGFFQQQSVAEQRINIDQEAGLISTIEAQRRLLDLRQEQIARLQTVIPLLEQEASITGNPDQIARLDQLKLKLYELQQQGSLLQTTFRNSFEQGLGNALTNLATNTASLKEAVLGLVRDVSGGLARLAAQQLSSLATAKLMQAFSRGKNNTPDLGAPDPAQAAAAGVAYAAPIGAAALALSSSAIPLTAAAAALQAAATSLAIANSIGGFGFAEGGFTGYGGKYQVAGVVHRGEGVLNQGEIRALGGPRGFFALRDAIAEGTLPRFANVPPPMAITAPRFSFAEGGFVGGGAMPAPEVNLRNYLMFDIEDIARRVAATSTFEREVVKISIVNGETIQGGREP